jgi:hypothetical protein
LDEFQTLRMVNVKQILVCPRALTSFDWKCQNSNSVICSKDMWIPSSHYSKFLSGSWHFMFHKTRYLHCRCQNLFVPKFEIFVIEKILYLTINLTIQSNFPCCSFHPWVGVKLITMLFSLFCCFVITNRISNLNKNHNYWCSMYRDGATS